MLLGTGFWREIRLVDGFPQVWEWFSFKCHGNEQPRQKSARSHIEKDSWAMTGHLTMIINFGHEESVILSITWPCATGPMKSPHFECYCLHSPCLVLSGVQPLVQPPLGLSWLKPWLDHPRELCTTGHRCTGRCTCKVHGLSSKAFQVLAQ